MKGIQGIQETNGTITVGDFFKNALFRDIIISLLATTGLYLIASVIFVSSSTLRMEFTVADEDL